MNARILTLELRRSAAFWAAVVSLPFIALWSSVPEGVSDVVRQMRIEVGLIVPLMLCIGAWQAGRDRRSRAYELIAATARPAWQSRLHTAAALGIGGIFGVLLVSATLTIRAAAIGAYLPVDAFVGVAVTALFLAGAAWLGLAVGRAAPWAIVPPSLVPAGLVGMLWVWFLTDTEAYTNGRPPASLLLNPVNTIGFDAFETLTARAMVAQVVWVVALAVASLLLYVVTRHRIWVAVVPAAFGLGLASSLLPGDLEDAITPDRAALALVCAPDDRVCVRRAHSHLLDDLREPGRRALDILSAKLPQAPTIVVDGYDVTGVPVQQQPRSYTLYTEVFTDGASRVEGTDRDILWSLLLGAGTLPCWGTVNTEAEAIRYNTARLVAAAWLLDEPPPPSNPDDPTSPSAAETSAAYEALLAMPANEQRARVAELRAAELACDGRDRLDILIGAGAA